MPRRTLREAVAVPVLAVAMASCAPSGSGANSTPTASGAASAATSPITPPPGVVASATALEQDFVAVVKRVRPSVVQIETSQGLGSGIVFDAKGDIVTNAHVVQGATQFTVTFADGRQRSGTLVGSFAADDIAAIHVDPQGGPPAAAFADSTKLEVGDIVMAIGNPLGLSSSVTEGIVSAVGRTVSEGNGFTLPDVTQTSAAINPGNSGGALVDLSGSVVGIPTLAATDPQLGGGSAPGIGFAIPSNTVTDIAGQLVATGRVTNSHRAYLGIRAAAADAGGVLVVLITAGSPAEHAGMQRGDVISAIDGKPTPTTSALNEILAQKKPGDRVPVAVTHQNGSTATLTVTLGELPGGA